MRGRSARNSVPKRLRVNVTVTPLTLSRDLTLHHRLLPLLVRISIITILNKNVCEKWIDRIENSDPG